jgi:hypothetical protein
MNLDGPVPDVVVTKPDQLEEELAAEEQEVVDLLRRAVSPDARDVPDDDLGSHDLSSDGEMMEWMERTGKSGKRKRKAKEAKGERPRKRPRGNAKWENSAEGACWTISYLQIFS